MFDPRKLKQQAAGLFIVAVIVKVVFPEAALVFTAITAAAFTMLALSWTMRDPKTPIRVVDLFENNLDINAFKDQLKQDEKFAAAVEYVFGLSTKDLMTFGRLITELRDQSNQGWLKEIARTFRKESK